MNESLIALQRKIIYKEFTESLGKSEIQCKLLIQLAELTGVGYDYIKDLKEEFKEFYSQYYK